MKKQLLLLVMMLLPKIASADAVEIDGIYYNLITKAEQAEVISNPDYYSGNIVIPETVNYNDIDYKVTRIGERAFQNCSNLTSITIPNCVTSIGSWAFDGCSGLKSIIIPNSVTTISDYTFHGCSDLTSIEIPNSVTSIGFGAFGGCSGLTSVTIPNSVTSIGSEAFSGCSSLTSVTIPNSVTTIDGWVFKGCTALTSVDIPNSVEELGTGVFYDCTALTSVTIPNNVLSIHEFSFVNCSSLTSVTIGNSIIYIELEAFSNCSSLTSIIIPNSVSFIYGRAFSGCSGLTSITIGSGIQSIAENAFASCSNLSDVTCYAENVPNTSSDAFKDAYINYTTLYVPSSAVNAYKEADPWKNFKEIVSIDGEAPTTQKCEKPTISYVNGQLKMSCATEGVEYVIDITDTDVKRHHDAIITLTATYNISVYATKSGYDNSGVATATLCWIDQQPKTEGITDGVNQIAARPALVKIDNGFITVEGIDDRTNVCIYTSDGKQVGSAVSQNNIATIATSIQPGSIAIVKIGEKSVKVAVK